MNYSKLTESFQKNGYLILKDAIPLEVIKETNNFLNWKIKDYLKVLNKAEKPDFLTISSIIKRDFNEMDETTKHLLSGHFDLQTRLDEKLYKIFNHSEKLLLILQKLLDSHNLYLHMPPAARWIMPSNEKAAVPPHQDISYNKHMSNFIVCWVPFVDITDKCGGVYVYNNTGNLGELEVEKGEFWLNGIDTTFYTGDHKKINQGDILLLNPYVLHSSFPNTSENIRISCDFRFFGDKDTSTKSYLDYSTGEIVRQH